MPEWHCSVATSSERGLDLKLGDRVRSMLRRLWTPACVLLVLAPFCAEGLTGNTPPQFFFFPPFLAGLMMLYGSGAILIREVTLRWNKGLPSRIALGAAYAICEEGFATKVFFEPRPASAGAQLRYGTWGGVHWPFTFFLVVFHAVFSIAIPIFLATLLFPAEAAKPWVSRRSLQIFGALFSGSVLVSALALHRYNPTLPHYGIAIGVVAALIAIARVLPGSIGPGRRPLAVSPKRLAIIGFSGTFTFWVVGFLFAAWHVPPAIALVSQFGIVLVGAVYLRRVEAGRYERFALAGGMLGFFVFTSFLLTPFSPLQPLVGGATWYGLRRFRRVLRARNVAEGSAP